MIKGDGFVLLYKRLENGRFKWPRDEQEAREITSQQFRWLLEGLSIVQPKMIQKSSPIFLQLKHYFNTTKTIFSKKN